MSAFTVPVQRPAGRAIVVGSAACRAQAVSVLCTMSCQAVEVEEPYAAMAELCRRPLVYRTLVLSLNSLYPEELQIISAIKQRFPGVGVWLSQTDGRAAALATALRLGADGLISDEGLHRLAPSEEAPTQAPPAMVRVVPASPQRQDPPPELDCSMAEPVLSAEELRALLHDPLHPGAE